MLWLSYLHKYIMVFVADFKMACMLSVYRLNHVVVLVFLLGNSGSLLNDVVSCCGTIIALK